jgi:hypothetical protein
LRCLTLPSVKPTSGAIPMEDTLIAAIGRAEREVARLALDVEKLLQR